MAAAAVVTLISPMSFCGEDEPPFPLLPLEAAVCGVSGLLLLLAMLASSPPPRSLTRDDNDDDDANGDDKGVSFSL